MNRGSIINAKRLPFREVLILVLITVGYRVFASHFGFLGNTAPLMAVTFGGALLLGSRCWWLPVLILIVSDLILGVLHEGSGIGGYTVMSALVYLLVAYLGGRAGRSDRMWPVLWCGTLVSSVIFYAVANTYSWLVWPGYEISAAGWWQSQTTGLPGYSPPAWMFLRNSLIADSIWCAVAGLLCLFRQHGEAREAAPVRGA